jgi:hypothetical protein
MKLNINTSQPFKFMQLCSDDGLDVHEIWLPAFTDVIDMPEVIMVCPIVEPLKRSDLCIANYPSFSTHSEFEMRSRVRS